MTEPADHTRSDGALGRLRLAHERRILDLLRERGPMTRHDLMTAAGLSRTTLYDIVLLLLKDGALEERRAAGPPRRGRPESVLSLNPRSASVAGIEIGRDHITVAVANAAHHVVASRQIARPARDGGTESGDLAARALGDALDGAGIDRTRLEAIVVGLPLPLDRDDSGPSAGGREEIAGAFSDAFGLRPAFHNNARLVALAEAEWGAAVDVADMIYLHLDQGVGGGLVMQRQLIDGPSGRAGEFGHVSVDPAGPVCWCGGRGCLERYVALPELLTAAGATEVAAIDLTGGRASLDDALRRLSQALSALLTVFDITTVVIGGAASAIPGLAPAVQTGVARIAPRHIAQHVAIRIAELGALGSARGGVALALRESRMVADYIRDRGTR